MNDLIISAAAKGLVRGFFFFVIWIITYLIWRLIFAKKSKERPWWLDTLLGLAISTAVGALGGFIGVVVVFGIYWLIRWLLQRKSKQNPLPESDTTSSSSISSAHQPTSSNIFTTPLNEYPDTVTDGTDASSVFSSATSPSPATTQKVFTGPAGGYWKNSSVHNTPLSPNVTSPVTPNNPSLFSSHISSDLPADPLVQSANAGDKDAQYRLGIMYTNGTGSYQDKSLAATWLTKAAEQGHAEAMYRLGLLFLKGEMVAQDKNKAKHWLTKAAKRGVLQAKTILNDLI